MVEILSPAGSIAALKSAVANRADAVYLGLDQFNARLKAENFTKNNITEWVQYCHLYGIKVYVTINTLIKQKELPKLDELLVCIEKAKVDAIIVTDLAVVARAKKLCPSVALHASTQMGIHNYLGAKFLEELGFTRVVLARECSIDDIKQIRKHTNLEIEYFVHGAMCVAFSGQCMLSSIASGNSGNRGLCLQLCRKEYSENLTNSKGYLISPKDQCLIDYVKQLEESGVNSLKIEGRLKSAEYVGLVTSKYKKAVLGDRINESDYSELLRVFNRGGFNKGYAFSGKNEILYTKVQNHMGERIGEVASCTKFKDGYCVKVKSNFELDNGDGLKLFREGREVGGFEVSIIEKNNNIYSLYCKQKFASGDSVNITFDSSLAKKYALANEIKIKLDLTVCVKYGEIQIITKYKKVDILYSEKCDIAPAIKVATVSDEIAVQLCKTGGTPFDFSIINMQIIGNIFAPKSVVNNVRRNFIAALEKKIISINEQVFKAENDTICKKINSENLNSFAEKYNINSLDNQDLVICDKIEFDLKNTEKVIKIAVNYNNFDESILKYAEKYNNIYIKLPKIAMSADLKIIENKLKSISKNVGIYADSYYAYYLAITTGRPVICGLGLNIMNGDSVAVLGVKSFVLSSELTKREIEDIDLPAGVFAFGYLPVMNFCHCPVQHLTGGTCADCKYKEYSLCDRYCEYKVRRIKIANCYFEMLNSSLHYIAKSLLPKTCSAVIDITALDNNADIVCDYLKNKNITLNNTKITKGHWGFETK